MIEIKKVGRSEWKVTRLRAVRKEVKRTTKKDGTLLKRPVLEIVETVEPYTIVIKRRSTMRKRGWAA